MFDLSEIWPEHGHPPRLRTAAGQGRGMGPEPEEQPSAAASPWASGAAGADGLG